jgi:hypothetical protein
MPVRSAVVQDHMKILGASARPADGILLRPYYQPWPFKPQFLELGPGLANFFMFEGLILTI